MSTSMIGLIITHGLPLTADEDPFDILVPLIHSISNTHPNIAIFRYDWREIAGTRSPGGLFMRAMRGTLGRSICDGLHVYVRDTIASNPDIHTWCIGGYSSGGWGIYEWLARGMEHAVTSSSSSSNKHLNCIFAIGSPFCIPSNGHITFNGKPWQAIDPDIDFIALAHGLNSSRGRIVWSTNDTLVPQECSSILSRLGELNYNEHALLFPNIMEYTSDVSHIELPQCSKSIAFLVANIL